MRLKERRPRANRKERSRSGEGWAVARDGVRGRTLTRTESNRSTTAPPLSLRERPVARPAGKMVGFREGGGESG